MGKVLFITGTDTGVGKTALTALLLARAQSEKMNVRALKPFSSGGREDEALLAGLQRNAFPTNFFHYSEPIAPWSAARLHNQPLHIDQVLSRIIPHRDACDLLLVEGAGGLLTPLGERFTGMDLILELRAEPVVVAINRLGVLNQVRLCVEVLRQRRAGPIKVVLMEHTSADPSRKTNLHDLTDLLPGIEIVALPHLPNYAADASFIRRAASELWDSIAQILEYKKNPPDTEAEGTFP